MSVYNIYMYSLKKWKADTRTYNKAEENITNTADMLCVLFALFLHHPLLSPWTKLLFWFCAHHSLNITTAHMLYPQRIYGFILPALEPLIFFHST